MDTILVAITVASLTLAITMSCIAWKLIRADRVRATARMDALRAMASRPDAVDDADEHVGPSREAAGPSLPVESAIVSPDEAPLSAGAMLAQAPPPSWDVLHADAHHDQFEHVSPLHREGMFDKGAEEGVAGRRWLALAAVALLMAAGVATVSALNSPEITAAVAASRSATAITEEGTFRPLELLSLRHENEGSGTFSISGLIENPVNGQSQSDIVAVVYLFNGGDRYFATARAQVERPVLAPGERSPFVVKVAGAANVQRYRVGFQRGDAGSILHVDRRGQAPESTTEAVAGDDTSVLAIPSEDVTREVAER